ncbi:MAG: NAD(P)/FAD-dependent oxidoreductase [Tindallia sp. MSAO_Bac2]|nr:MAG: NAD(P)/FAD-dependent oxidoreductase [Tindallia sp. MSAO_Bac2]
MTVIKTDVLILGGGPAGFACALECAKNGLDTTLVEKEEALGGTGFRTGCLPVKYLLDQLKLIKKAEKSGLNIDVNWSNLFERSKAYVSENSGKMEEELKRSGVRLIYGSGAFTDLHTYEIEDEKNRFRIEASRIVMATGTRPGYPKGLEPDGEKIITHREAVVLNKVPESLIILGGEVEGLEFASLFSEMGSRVTVLEMLPDFLTGMDEDLREPLINRLKDNQVILKSGCKVEKATLSEDGVAVYSDTGQLYQADKALVAMSRKACFPAGFDKLQLDTELDRIIVDHQCKTSKNHIYAVGDINGRMEMAHTAWQQGLFLGRHLASGTDIPWEYEALPRAMFTIPENAGAGKQEKELAEEGVSYLKGAAYWRDTWRGAVQPWSEGHVKVLADDKGRLLGVWMTGLDIGELVGFLGMMVQEKMHISDMEKHLMVHPTLSEGIMQAIGKIRL